jgi:hypothetical protein
MAKNEEKKAAQPEKVEKPASPESLVSTSQYASKIDAIKDIIFGEDYAALRRSLQELDEKFENKMAQLDDRLSAVIQDLDRTLNNKLDNVEMDLKSEIDRLDHHKTDRFKLGKMLEELGRSLQE